MTKVLALGNVIAWGAFWTFGLIAVFAELAGSHLLVAALLSGLGFLGGMACHLALCNRVAPTQRVAPRAEA